MEKQQFTIYEEAKAAYAEEARARWGDTAAYKDSEARSAKRSKTENDAVMNAASEIFEAFAALLQNRRPTRGFRRRLPGGSSSSRTILQLHRRNPGRARRDVRGRQPVHGEHRPLR